MMSRLRPVDSNVEGISKVAFTSPNNAIISNIYDYLGTQICILIKFYFSYIFK